jgi:hypothetical protein
MSAMLRDGTGTGSGLPRRGIVLDRTRPKNGVPGVAVLRL